MDIIQNKVESFPSHKVLHTGMKADQKALFKLKEKKINSWMNHSVTCMKNIGSI